MRAWVFVKHNTDCAGEVLRDVSQIEGVVAASPIRGTYPLLAEVEVGGVHELDDLLDAIGSIGGVQRTHTAWC